MLVMFNTASLMLKDCARIAFDYVLLILRSVIVFLGNLPVRKRKKDWHLSLLRTYACQE